LHYGEILIPGLAADLERVEVASRLGLLQRTHPLLTFLAAVVLLLLLIALLVGAAWRLLRRHRKAAAAT
jgi:hypothetical protein